MGPGASGGMGEGQLSYRDLQAWQEVTGIELVPWEAKTLRTLSFEYLSERQKAEALDRPAPYTGEQDEIAANRKRVAQQIKSAFAGLKRKGG